MENALPESQRRRAMLTVLLTVVLDLVGFGIVIPLMTFFAEGFSATPVQVTLLMTSFSVAQFVFAPMWGQLSDRIGRRPVLVLSIGMTAFFLAAFASATSLPMLFVFRILHGMATANISTAQACMADLSSKENRARAMGMIGAAFGLGFTIGPVIGGGFSPGGFLVEALAPHGDAPSVFPALYGLISRLGITFPLWIAATLSALNFVQALLLLPETRRPGSAPAHRKFDPAALLNTLRHSALGLCVLVVFLQVLAFAMMESTFTLFAEHAHGLTAAKVGEMFGIIGVVGIVVQGGMIRPLVKRFGEKPLIIAGLLILAVSLVLLPLAPLGLPLTTVFALIAAGQGISNPSLNGLISRTASDDEQGTILGSSQSMGALARAAGPLLGGLLYQQFAMSTPFFASAILLAMGAALAIPATQRAMAKATPPGSA